MKTTEPKTIPLLTELSPEQKRCLIAEACGWTYEKSEEWPKRRPKRYRYILQAPDQKLKVLPEFTVRHADPEKDEIWRLRELPLYLTDLNAIAEARGCLDPHETWAAIVWLVGWQPAPSGFPLLSKSEAIMLANASAAAWSDAFLLAKGLAAHAAQPSGEAQG